MSDSLFDPPVDRMRDRATSGALMIGVSQAVKFAVQTLSVITLSRLLQPQDFGLVAMIGPLLVFLGMFQDLGLTQAAVQRKVLTHNQASWLFWVNFGVGCALTVLLCATAPLIGAFYNDPRITTLVLAYSVFMAIGGATAQHMALLNRQMRFKALAIIEAAAFAVGFVVALIIAWISRTYWAMFFSTVTTSLLTLAAVWLKTGWIPSWPKREPGIRDLLTFGAGVTGFNFANFISRNLDSILIGKAWGSIQLGLYDRAYKLLLFPLQQINFPLARVMLPALSRFVDQDLRYRSAFVRTARMIVLVTQPGVLVMTLTADWMVPTLLGWQWAPAAPIFTWLGLAGLVQPYNSATGWLFVSQGRTTQFARWGFFSAAICAVAFVIGLPDGPIGVARAYAIATLALAVPMWWYAGRSGPVGFTHIWRTAAVFVPSLIVTGAALYLFHDWAPLGRYAGLAVSVVLAYSLYVAVLALLPTGREILGEAIQLATQPAPLRRFRPKALSQDG